MTDYKDNIESELQPAADAATVNTTENAVSTVEVVEATETATETAATETAVRHHRRAEKEGMTLLFKIRTVLNVLFIVGAAVGMYLYFFQNQTVGTIVIIIFAAMKFAECILRFLDK